MPLRYHSIDLWRGVACLAVLAFHVSGPSVPITGSGWLGVTIFFVISGYCIAAAADRHAQHGRPLREFAWRRWRRIVPPYLQLLAGAALALTVAYQVPAAAAILSGTTRGLEPIARPSQMNAWQWVGTATLTEGWRSLVIWQGGPHWLLGHAWTLGFEEQFYVVTGVLIACCGRRWLWGAAGVTVATVLVRTVVAHPPAGVFVSGYWLLFAVGVGVFAHLHGHAPRWLLPACLGAAGLWVLRAPEVSATNAGQFALEIAVACGFAACLIALYPYDARLRHMAVLRPLHWCGERCYSIYLVHWPIAKVVGGLWPLTMSLPITCVLTLGVAALFHRYCERPWMNTVKREQAVAVAA